MTRISDKSRSILNFISQGHSYQQIIDAYPQFTYFDIFSAAQEALDVIDSEEQRNHEKVAYRVENIRQKHPNAYEKWDDEQDKKLKQLYTSGMSTYEIAIILKRQAGAITSRIKKLGIVR